MVPRYGRGGEAVVIPSLIDSSSPGIDSSSPGLTRGSIMARPMRGAAQKGIQHGDAWRTTVTTEFNATPGRAEFPRRRNKNITLPSWSPWFSTRLRAEIPHRLNQSVPSIVP